MSFFGVLIWGLGILLSLLFWVERGMEFSGGELARGEEFL